MQALTVVKLREHSEQAIMEFEEAVKGVVGVRACYHVTGQFDMVMVLALRDLTHLAQMIRVELAKIPGVMQLETMLIMAESVADEGWPVFPEAMTTAGASRTGAPCDPHPRRYEHAGKEGRSRASRDEARG